MALAYNTMEKPSDQTKSNRKQNNTIKSLDDLSDQPQIEIFHISSDETRKKFLEIDVKRSINMLLHIEVYNSSTLTIEGAKESVRLGNSRHQRYHERTIAIGLETDLEAAIESSDDIGHATIRILEVY
ncbi:hypothetical protein [Fodinibius halophilus]|uniref:Uncharacterized protein n=1 Tax=Fodinibius halophilus TaxID=1736908 RepID=A0A6M1T2C0_9BACT|nr:hypothetical protein [Fodinibius halophilus]NGP90218.1 hypothetical protein [Fodinibius halophilus]